MVGLNPVGGEGLSKPSPEPLLHVTASGITPDPAPVNRDKRHPVPLDAPDVALRGQRLLAYGESCAGRKQR